jgi:histidinol phosphatase-like enzyme (inositol monophosphatase family)
MLRDWLDFAVDAAWQTGRLTLGYFQAGVTAERKADNSPVTIADKQAEQKLRELIGRHFPEHGILGEEFGHQKGSSNLTWIIDPIDGTKSFVHGVPLYGVLLALADESGPLVGVSYFPALDEMLYAARGEGCYWNGRRTQVSNVNDLKDAVMLSSEVQMFIKDKRTAAWAELAQTTYIQRTWGDAYGYFLVATGRAEIMIDVAMNAWDCGPFGVILPEAGGTFTDLSGVSTIYGGNALGTNGHVFPEVMRIING